MNELTVVNFNGIETIDSRLIAETIGKEHHKLLRDIRTYCDYLNESKIGLVDFFIASTYTDGKGEIRPCYLCTRKGCEMIANKLTGQKGVVFTAMYINAFHDMETQLQMDSYMIADPVKRAERWIEEQKEKQELETAKKQLLLQIETDKPKTIFADAVSTSKNSILIGELAKILKQNGIEIGQNKLFKYLRENGCLIKRKGSDYNMPTQRSMEMGLFEIKETVITHADGRTSVSKTTKVTGKGQIYFVNHFLKKEDEKNAESKVD